MLRASFWSGMGGPVPNCHNTEQPTSQAMPGPTLARVRPLLFTRLLAQKKRGCGCCSCLCRTLSLLLILFVIIGITVVILYFVFDPKVPKYSVDQLRISDLKLNPDLSLYAKFKVRITAYNPNDKIGIHYEKGGKMSVWYGSNELCKGTVPSFYQGHRDRRAINVDLTGKNKYGSILMAALQQQAGNIPLHLKVNMPVAVELGSLKLRTVRFLVSCLLVVDSISYAQVYKSHALSGSAPPAPILHIFGR